MPARKRILKAGETCLATHRKITSPSLPRNSGDHKAVGDQYIQIARGNKAQWRILYRAKLSFRNEGQIKIFLNGQKLGEVVTTAPDWQAMCQGVLPS